MMFICLTAIYSCEGFVDGYDENPNLPTEVTPPLLLTTAELATAVAYSGQLARTSCILIQQTEGTDFQLDDVSNYIMREGNNDNEWNSIYTDGLIEAQTLIEVAGDGNPHYQGIAKVVMAMGYGLATDMWGDIPFSQALKGLSEGLIDPSYDTQEDVISGIQTLLDEAIALLSTSPDENVSTPGNDDLFFGGDAAAWTKVAWVLKARYANRLSNANAAEAGNVLSYLESADMTTNADGLFAPFGSSGNELNPWAAFQSSRAGYQKIGEGFVNYLLDTNDPRITAYAATDTSGEYTGAPVNSVLGDGDYSEIGAGIATATNAVPLVTYVEVKFLEAEAALRGGDDARATAAYIEAISASLDQYGVSDSTFSANLEAVESVTMEDVMMQKYVALFSQVEPYNDWRRTGIPALSPNPDGDVASIPVRFPAVLDERVNNPNATIVTDITSPVWWDK